MKSHLVIPPIVFGLSSGRLVDLGVQNRHSVAIPWILKGAVAEGKVRVVGEGKNIWGNVHVDEREYHISSETPGLHLNTTLNTTL